MSESDENYDARRSSDTVDLFAEPPTAEVAPRPASMVVEYARRRPGNRAATVSLVAGLLLFVPFFSGIVAIRFGRRGLRAARDVGGDGRRRARVGIVLGWFNIVASILFVATLPSAFMRARRAADTVACQSNLRQIGLAMMLYMTANGGHLPPSFDPLGSGRFPAPGVFICPACARDPRKRVAATMRFGPCDYVFVPSSDQLVRRRFVVTYVVVAYEPLTNHDGRLINVLFADLHVEAVPAAIAQRMIPELNAGQNPPPSLLTSKMLSPAMSMTTTAPAAAPSAPRSAPPASRASGGS